MKTPPGNYNVTEFASQLALPEPATMPPSPIPRLHTPLLWLGAFSSAAPSFYLRCVLANGWRESLAWNNGRYVRYGAGLLVLALVLPHSDAFMAAISAGKQKLT